MNDFGQEPMGSCFGVLPCATEAQNPVRTLKERGVPPGSPNPDPISDQNMPFSTPVFRPDL